MKTINTENLEQIVPLNMGTLIQLPHAQSDVESDKET